MTKQAMACRPSSTAAARWRDADLVPFGVHGDLFRKGHSFFALVGCVFPSASALAPAPATSTTTPFSCFPIRFTLFSLPRQRVYFRCRRRARVDGRGWSPRESAGDGTLTVLPLFPMRSRIHFRNRAGPDASGRERHRPSARQYAVHHGHVQQRGQFCLANCTSVCPFSSRSRLVPQEARTMKTATKPRKSLTKSTGLDRLVNPRFFAEATRESGYKGTSNAIAEIVDNSIQSKATEVHIWFTDLGNDPTDITVFILDNGCGMDAATLGLALQFGGTTRFDNRDGMGRFGMGLPNASVSQCRRLEVYTRRTGGPLLHSHLDLDEVSAGDVNDGFLQPGEIEDWPLPPALAEFAPKCGTLVIWKKCDRLQPRNFDSLRRKITGHLGQAFRNFIYPVNDKPARLITVNGAIVKPFDPLYLDPRAEWTGAEERSTSHYDLPIPGRKGETSRVTVRFSILPIEEWQLLPLKERIARRITANRGFSIVRAGREIEVTDRYFLSGLNGQEGRITNNDAWWGCEISFDAKLDEVLGVTHTKQEVHPNIQLLQRIRDDITATVATLRSEYDKRRIKKTPNQTQTSEEIATRNDRYLPPPPEVAQKPDEYQRNLAEYLEKTSRDGETKEKAEARVLNKTFTIELESAKEGPFYRTTWLGQNTIVYVNTDHPFYSEIYSDMEDNPNAQIGIEFLLFALARGERSAGEDGKLWYQSQRSVWSAALRAYLNQ